ncbi:unnamed protein product, partial [Tuber aestivum]
TNGKDRSTRQCQNFKQNPSIPSWTTTLVHTIPNSLWSPYGLTHGLFAFVPVDVLLQDSRAFPRPKCFPEKPSYAGGNQSAPAVRVRPKPKRASIDYLTRRPIVRAC